MHSSRIGLDSPLKRILIESRELGLAEPGVSFAPQIARKPPVKPFFEGKRLSHPSIFFEDALDSCAEMNQTGQ